MQLNNIAEIYDGTHQTPKYVSSGVPFISAENIGSIYDSKKFIEKEVFSKYKIIPRINDIFMTKTGSIGKCAIMNKETKLTYSSSLALIRPDTSLILPKYLKYYIESSYGKRELAKKTLFQSFPIRINKCEIEKIMIFFPSLNIQKEIVNKLDNFEFLTNNMVKGIPAEIEARQKQYVYYRDFILTFKELKT